MSKPRHLGSLEDIDRWELPETKIEIVPWTDLSCGGKLKRVLWDYLIKILLLIGLLYMFICSLDFLSSAFKLLGGKAAGKAFAENEILSNPVAGVMIGVLVTVLVQSSSTSTSIIITMVGGGVLYAKNAVFLVMGANIGTTVTNTIVALGQARRRDEFRRAFAAATVHDMFNWLSVFCLFIIEVASGFLFWLTGKIVNSFHLETNEEADVELLKKITKPFTDEIVKLNKDVIKALALGSEEAASLSLLKRDCCVEDANGDDIIGNSSFGNLFVYLNGTNTGLCLCDPRNATCDDCTSGLFSQTSLDDNAVGAILLVIALIVLCICLVCIIKLLHSLLKGQIAKAIKKFINADFPGRWSFLTGYLAILLGAGITILVQSSSIFTSTLTPLVGIGLIKLERMYPLTLGSNIGTTATGLLAAMATSGENLDDAMQVALVHLFFNIIGICIWYPIPVMRRVPIRLAKVLGETTERYRWFALFYLFALYFILPGAVFGLSLAGWQVLAAVGIPVVVIVVIASIINVLQVEKPNWLPAKLRTWEFLPLCLHSLEPLDNACQVCICCEKLKRDPEAAQENGLAPTKGQDNPTFKKEDGFKPHPNTKL